MIRKREELAKNAIYHIFEIIIKNNGEMYCNDALNHAKEILDIDPAFFKKYESGGEKWKYIIRFNLIRCSKSGLFIMRRGRWYVTPEGEEIFKKGINELWSFSKDGYKKWSENKKDNKESKSDIDDTIEASFNKVSIEEVLSLANEGIKNYIKDLNPYEFQDLCAALLRSMGYFTPFVAPKGKDGGIDIIAYTDPLGVKPPRIKVQVKHIIGVPTKVTQIRELLGLISNEGDVGIFIASGGFTSDSKATARSSQSHLELIDMDRLIELWGEHYSKMPDEDKNILPLVHIPFVNNDIE